MLTDTLMLQIAGAVSRWFELAGIAAIVVGALIALVRFVVEAARRRARPASKEDVQAEPISNFRKTLGRSILVGLELLVAADIIRTVAIEPTMESVLVLAVIVLIRTFLSLSLEVEIDGKWPWRREDRGSK